MYNMYNWRDGSESPQGHPHVCTHSESPRGYSRVCTHLKSPQSYPVCAHTWRIHKVIPMCAHTWRIHRSSPCVHTLREFTGSSLCVYTLDEFTFPLLFNYSFKGCLQIDPCWGPGGAWGHSSAVGIALSIKPCHFFPVPGCFLGPLPSYCSHLRRGSLRLCVPMPAFLYFLSCCVTHSSAWKC